jgi:hypothetical protein
MKPGKSLLLVVAIALVLAAPLAWGQEEIIVIQSKPLAPHTRPLVTFNHQEHSETYECSRCHHDYDENYNNPGGNESKCSQCHQVSPGPGQNPVPLVMAVHRSCKSCHTFLLERGKPSGPVMCGQCHRGAAAAPQTQ